jgi:hypothetical protein
MKTRFTAGALFGAALLLWATGAAAAEDSGVVAAKARSGTFLDFLGKRSTGASGRGAQAKAVTRPNAAASSAQVISSANAAAASGGLPLWTFKVRSSRDGNVYQGAMVGTSPFSNPRSTSVPAVVVPVVFHLHSVATAISATTGAVTTAPGHYTASPTAHDRECLSAPNNEPARILLQSPLFNSVPFSFGGTSLGTTQYIDAVQRGNFYYANPSVPGSYHLLFSPVNRVEALEIDVPADEGVAIPSALIDATFGVGPAGPGCGTLGLVDIDWFDQLLNAQAIPQLAVEAGVSPANLPIFLLYNTVLGGPPTVGFGDCCIGGYHSSGGFPTPTQTYAVTDFDTTGEFGVAFANTAVIAHELGEWANDPFGINLVAPWGDTGQVSGCQGNLEVGDPLTGTVIPAVTGANGFTYDLQELAFFSWFQGAPSIAINGWFSVNGTFTNDAGPPCSLQ